MPTGIPYPTESNTPNLIDYREKIKIGDNPG